MIIIHRVNTIEKLKTINKEYGTEIDIRHDNKTGRLYLNHDPGTGEDFEEYLKIFSQQGNIFIIFNIKETGIEQKIIDLAEKYNIKYYFLLDVEFPYLYMATRKQGFRKIAVRYSEAEPIEAVESQTINGKPLLDWVWIDTNTVLPLNEKIVTRLKPYKTCLVCPERWGRLEDIPNYIKKIKELNFKLDAVMTSLECSKLWEEYK